MAKSSVKSVKVNRINSTVDALKEDLVAVEEPLEIRLGYGSKGDRQQRQIAVTMRTPGHDLELAAGFLFTEGIIESFSNIEGIKHCEDVGREEDGNVVRVELSPEVTFKLESVERNFYTTSSCGVCGKASIDAIHIHQHYEIQNSVKVDRSILMGLSETVADKQTVFIHTGGIHASALFDVDGSIHALREDVGRHNALDKIVGTYLLKDKVPLHDYVLWVSGRASFELVQKAVMAGISIMVAVGAPSSLAVDLANSSGLTLIGFLKNDRLNIYTHPERIQ